MPIYSIVDVHAYTSDSGVYGQQLYDNILKTTASLLALGLDPNKSILFRQSDLLEHCYIDNVLDNFVTARRLTHMTQFKEKSKSSKFIWNSLLNYPVLQTADILTYRANLVPVGEDQVQHIELARDIAHKFNSRYDCQLFPEPKALLQDSPYARRVKSLRSPEKKMSKSDPTRKSYITVIDSPDVILENCKKSLTDEISAVYYDPENRRAVSNLMILYHLVTGNTFEQITKEFERFDTGQFKLRLADVLIDKFSEARTKYEQLISHKDYLEEVLKMGELKARPIAADTVRVVKHLLGSYRQW